MYTHMFSICISCYNIRGFNNSQAAGCKHIRKACEGPMVF